MFANSRRLAERLALKLNELAGEDLVRAHHGSLAREQRLLIEEMLKEGRLPALVATSSLELGIDMGAVDLVIQVESPLSVARGLQRVGRAGHQVGEPSKGVIFPKYRGDLLECAVVTRLMHEGAIEPTVVPRNPLDVLAQQIVAACVERPWRADELYALVRGAENYAELGRESFEAVLGMLAGPVPQRRVRGAAAARHLGPRRGHGPVAAATPGPSRSSPAAPSRSAACSRCSSRTTTRPRTRTPGPAHVPGRRASGGRRVGELDEEMVYEAREGEVILLGASAWRIESIGHDRVLVSPAPGEPGKVPFWKGDGVGRPVELGRALGAFTREMGELASSGDARPGAGDGARSREPPRPRSRSRRTNLLAYLEEERGVTGALPTDRTIVLQRFRDELGDWRVCLLSPFGARVHAPWALAIEARLRERLGVEVQPIWSDDGIVRPAAIARRTASTGPADERRLWTWASGRGVTEAAEAAVLIAVGRDRGAGRRRRRVVGAVRQPLPRERGAGAAAAASPAGQPDAAVADAPALGAAAGGRSRATARSRSSSRRTGSASRTCSTCPALREILAAIERREVRIVSVETPRASPFASSLLFDYIAAYMYEGDAPLRRPAGPGAGARPGPAARAAGCRGAAGAARRGRPGRARAGAARR